jgi:hypothetical protein
MKGLLITLGAVAVIAGIVYYYRDNENVRQVLDKVSDTANDTLNKLNDNWGKAKQQVTNTARQATGAMAEQA